MRVLSSPLEGILEIEPEVFRDERGFFLESFSEPRFAAYGLPTHFRQDNHSRSSRDVLRGLHYQWRRPQGKLVTVIRGAVFDVAVDIRSGSPSFGKWHGVLLSEDSPRYVWIPPGFAHGFCVLSEIADVVYKCTDVYVPDDARGIAWNDPGLGIEWPVQQPILSPMDQRFSGLSASRGDLPRYP
jgi:dTDP-4-dehydrorhamnose 3,5-epimerase